MNIAGLKLWNHREDLCRADGLGRADNAGDASVDDGNRIFLDVRRLLYVLLHLADPFLLQLLKVLQKQHTAGGLVQR